MSVSGVVVSPVNRGVARRLSARNGWPKTEERGAATPVGTNGSVVSRGADAALRCEWWRANSPELPWENSCPALRRAFVPLPQRAKPANKSVRDRTSTLVHEVADASRMECEPQERSRESPRQPKGRQEGSVPRGHECIPHPRPPLTHPLPENVKSVNIEAPRLPEQCEPLTPKHSGLEPAQAPLWLCDDHRFTA